MLQFRLLYDTPSTGKRNMAVDEAILSAVLAGDAPPTLRLYAWQPPCLSLGYGQRWRDADLERIADNGWHIVRRVTGGRAILHTDELTYSLTLPAGHPLGEGTIIESYRLISRGLMAALGILGLRTNADPMTKPALKPGPVCFEVPSHYEIKTGDGRKLVGSAQYRRKGAVLQHGTLPICGDIARICDALVFDSEYQRESAKKVVRQRAVTLADALGGIEKPWSEVADAVAEGFEQALYVEMVESRLTAYELAHAASLEADVYGAAEWTQKL